MSQWKPILLRWLPAIVLMAAIFAFSATPSKNLPDYGFWDKLVKKGGHMTGYGLLSVAFWFGLRFDPKKGWLAWLLAVLYAATDEFHQSFVPGRHASVDDVLIFDNLGAILALLATTLAFKFFPIREKLKFVLQRDINRK